MPPFNPVFGPVGGTHLYVDGSWAGGQADGGQLSPFATIAEGIAAMAVGDVLLIEPGVYVEDLVLAAGEDYYLKARIPGSVTITGSMVSTDATATLEGINLIDDGAGLALHVTGVAADVFRMILCEAASTVGGDAVIEMDNTAGTLEIQGGRMTADVGNANEVLRLESGTIDILETDITHGSDVAESIVCEGDAASALTMRDCRCVGSVNSEVAAVIPTMNLDGCDVTVGAISALIVAATATIECFDSRLTSADAGNDAIDGAGAVVLRNVTFPGAADEIATTITCTHEADSRVQQGRYTEAAGAGVRAIALPQIFPSTSYNVHVTYVDTGTGAQASSNEVDTIATTGFNLTTQGDGIYHWTATHD